MSFAKKWERNEDPSSYEKVVEVIRPSDPLKVKLVSSVKRIEAENQRLEQAYAQFQKRENELFAKTTESYKAHDKVRATIYANEVAEIRKIKNMILQYKLALEQISLRMRTSTELGDVAASLLPVVGIMTELKPSIISITPETEKELGSLGEMLTGMIVDGGMVNVSPITLDTVTEDASKILGEAQVIAEDRFIQDFPQIPKKSGQFISGEDASP